MKIQKILIIDDDASVRKVVSLTLRVVEGWEIYCAESCEEALDLLNNFTPDLILLDMMMPVTDGVETLAILKQSPYAHVPVFFMTAKALKHEVEGYLQMGVVGVISKPFEPRLLGQQIRAMMQDRGAVRMVS